MPRTLPSSNAGSSCIRYGFYNTCNKLVPPGSSEDEHLVSFLTCRLKQLFSSLMLGLSRLPVSNTVKSHVLRETRDPCWQITGVRSFLGTGFGEAAAVLGMGCPVRPTTLPVWGMFSRFMLALWEQMPPTSC